MKTRAHVIVSGRVQGVYFRGKTRNEAKKHGVNGWVRNLPDGRVDAMIEGEMDNVEGLIDFMGRGPSYAKVTDLKLEWLEYTGEFRDFRILY
ncbi:MAG: acylphosphatase [Methanobacterium sp.]|uniref:acylphosphatase n=1 Tax=Methanobacterium sp. TaxID=2164 RepID=UPI003D654CF8|nr:acylphosphatase [Methanobacterium sp.]